MLLNNPVKEEDNKIPEEVAVLLEKFPFLSYGHHKDREYLGIIQNSDNKLVSMYVLDLMVEDQVRRLFLDFGHNWWWNSNRQIPINMFIKDNRFRIFRESLRHFATKDFDHLAGPSVSLADALTRRVRKRQITLVRKIP